jgi:hypothetical protein
MARASKPPDVQIKLPYNMQNQILRLDASRPAFWWMAPIEAPLSDNTFYALG